MFLHSLNPKHLNLMIEPATPHNVAHFAVVILHLPIDPPKPTMHQGHGAHPAQGNPRIHPQPSQIVILIGRRLEFGGG